ncbi:uncharacterized protein LOC143340904 [Colletes latitarsis]|uniref:uncharacterized protein LOC143340904 n=1 Tax=Colletes latitarsis TaxID=2605962 RepID=UPI004036BC9D
MKSLTLNALFVLAVTYSLIVQAQQQDCTCGGLGSGTNPCTCSETLVKAAKLPTPTYYVSPQDINDAAAVRNSIDISTATSQNSYSNSQSVSVSNPITYSNINSNSHTGGTSNVHVNSDSTTYSSTSSNTYSNSDSSTSSNTYSNSGSSSSSSPVATVAHTDIISVPESSSKSNSGCGCNKQTSESIEIDDSINSNVNVVPSFPPIGDLCYPLPVDSRSGKLLLEKTRVTPAHPGKIICNRCNPSIPYEICTNVLTGEITSRAITSSTSDATSGSSPIIYGTANPAASSRWLPGIFTAPSEKNRGIAGTMPGILSRTQFGSSKHINSGAFSGSTSGSFSRSRLGSFGNVNSGAFGSKLGIHGTSNSGSFNRPNSGIFSLPPLAHISSNTASGYNQHTGISMSSSSSNCFDDDTDEIPVDYSYPEMPADAVSLTLAYKNLRAPNVIYRQGKQFVPEDKLSFGHRTMPNDVKNEKNIPDIPEEKLVTVEKPVVELKLAPPRTVVIGSYDEREEAKLAELEAIERESITQEETADQVADSLLTYKDLGYAPVGSMYMRSRNHNEMISGDINDSGEEPCGPLGPPVPDYVPGAVLIQQEVTDDNFDNMNQMQQTNPSNSGSCPS